ncbi:TPA: hypothetical protein NHR53_006676 [Pseudomonas aeruginosa]|nr:hypothetical protein [Pseudomonas aeruginosa]HCE8130060.1 hypothetical protein [Pseudomonas aeruginosa]HCF0448352.1 hypothetical protein [Pseudomonas aeruginosa]
MTNKPMSQQPTKPAENTTRAEEIFNACYLVKQKALRQALRDPACWVDQVMVIVVGGIRAACLFLLLKGAGLFVLWGGDILAAQGPWLDGLALLISMPVVVLNPRDWFFSNVFAARAWKAFDDALAAQRNT